MFKLIICMLTLVFVFYSSLISEILPSWAKGDKGYSLSVALEGIGQAEESDDPCLDFNGEEGKAVLDYQLNIAKIKEDLESAGPDGEISGISKAEAQSIVEKNEKHIFGWTAAFDQCKSEKGKTLVQEMIKSLGYVNKALNQQIINAPI